MHFLNGLFFIQTNLVYVRSGEVRPARGSSFGSLFSEFPAVSTHTVLGIARAGTELYSNKINSIQQTGVLKYVTCTFYMCL